MALAKLSGGKALRRETAEMDRKRPIVIRLHPHFLELYPKGTREVYALTYDALLDHARLMEAKRKELVRRGAKAS